MNFFSLYLESGPKMRTTMVHIPELLGCISRGKTTAKALENAPAEIRRFQKYLKTKSKNTARDDEFALKIAEHVMEGPWIGYGDPAPGFAFDFEPLPLTDQQLYLARLNWMTTDLLGIIQELTREQLFSNPPDGHRSIFHILEHTAESETVYLRYLVGKVDGISSAMKKLKPEETGNLMAPLAEVFSINSDRLCSLTELERRQHVPHGQVTWSARRCFRRCLEHAWEHLLEIDERFPGIISSFA